MMQATTLMAQPQSGLYKQMKYLNQDGREVVCDKDIYLLLKDGKTYEIQSTVNGETRRLYLLEKDMKSLKGDEKQLTYTWTYDPSGYPGGQDTEQITNVYIPAKSIMSKEMNAFLGLMDRADKKGVKKNKLLGVWHEADESNTLYYKMYDKAVRMTIHVAKVGEKYSMVFTIEDVEYINDEFTKEGGNPCIIKWQGTNSHTLSYNYNGYTFAENWTRTQMPACILDIFD